jgi:4-amino-4-deoxy-L-arabinose transferase-like glycosyltransferase
MWFASAGWAVGAVTLANAVRPRAGVESRAGILVRGGEKLDALVRAREWRSAPAPLNRTQLIRLLSIMLIAFPLELALVTTSGNAFDHYFLALLPVFAGLGAFAFCTALGLWDRARLKPRVSTALAVVLVLAAAVLFAADAARIVRRLRVRMESYKGILEYIMVRTGAQDTVFIWQGEARVAFHVRREIATRFINPAPVRREGYATADKVLELLRDLEEHRPRFLFDAHVGTPAFFQFPVLTPEIEARRRELLSHYQERESVGSWTVYELHAP